MTKEKKGSEERGARAPIYRASFFSSGDITSSTTAILSTARLVSSRNTHSLYTQYFSILLTISVTKSDLQILALYKETPVLFSFFRYLSFSSALSRQYRFCGSLRQSATDRQRDHRISGTYVLDARHPGTSLAFSLTFYLPLRTSSYTNAILFLLPPPLPPSLPFPVMYWSDMWTLIVKRLYSRYFSFLITLRVYVPFGRGFRLRHDGYAFY